MKIFILIFLTFFSFNSLQAGWFGKSKGEKFDEKMTEAIKVVQKTLPQQVNRYTQMNSIMYGNRTVYHSYLITEKDYVINKEYTKNKVQNVLCAENLISLFKEFNIKRRYSYNDMKGNILFETTVYSKDC